MEGGKGAATGGGSSGSKDMLQAATDFVMALVRGSAKGWGQGLRVLGEELEKFGEEGKDSTAD